MGSTQPKSKAYEDKMEGNNLQTMKDILELCPTRDPPLLNLSPRRQCLISGDLVKLFLNTTGAIALRSYSPAIPWQLCAALSNWRNNASANSQLHLDSTQPKPRVYEDKAEGNNLQTMKVTLEFRSEEISTIVRFQSKSARAHQLLPGDVIPKHH